jgi:hypothetical protein
MEQQEMPKGRLVGAAIALLLINLAAVIWLGFSQEMLRADIARLGQTVRELPRAASPESPAPELQAMTEALGKLSAQVDALAATDPAKAVARLAAEVKTLSGRVEALAAARTASAKAASPKATPAKNGKSAPYRNQDEEDAPRPFFGPGYPAWPGY